MRLRNAMPFMDTGDPPERDRAISPHTRLVQIIDLLPDSMDEEGPDPCFLDALLMATVVYRCLLLLSEDIRAEVEATSTFAAVTAELSLLDRWFSNWDPSDPELREPASRWVPLREGVRRIVLHLSLNLGLD